jgi:hypothetical protein
MNKIFIESIETKSESESESDKMHYADFKNICISQFQFYF